MGIDGRDIKYVFFDDIEKPEEIDLKRTVTLTVKIKARRLRKIKRKLNRLCRKYGELNLVMKLNEADNDN